jgi:hypothetical protein
LSPKKFFEILSGFRGVPANFAGLGIEKSDNSRTSKISSAVTPRALKVNASRIIMSLFDF